MQRNISPTLYAIINVELALGNVVARVNDDPPLPLAIVFKEPIHRTQVEAATTIEPPIRWYDVGAYAGYVSEDTGQSVQGPTSATADSMEEVRRKLAPSLQAICDLELSLGNSLDRVEEPAGDRCPLAIIFKQPMHKATIESTLSLPSIVKWWECRDPHYPIQGGYACGDTHHAVAGPLG